MIKFNISRYISNLPLIFILILSPLIGCANTKKGIQQVTPSSKVQTENETREYMTFCCQFNLNPKTHGGYHLPRGSTVIYLKGGITQVLDSDNKTILWAREADLPMATVPGPKGQEKPNRIFETPNGALIKEDGDITRVYDKNELVLTVIHEDRQSSVGANATDNNSQSPPQIFSPSGQL